MKRLSLALMLLFSTTLCVVSTAQKHRNHLNKTEQTTTTNIADSMRNSSASILNSVDSDFDDDGFDGRFDHDEDNINDLKAIENGLNTFQSYGVWGFAVLALMIICAIVAVLLPVVLLIVLLRYIIKRQDTKAQLEQMRIKQAMEQPVNREEYWAHEDEFAWRKGVQLVALGAGLAFFFFILGAGPLSGIGLLILCIGLGKLYIGKRAKKNREENTEE
ncbi:DUF6249 domain-containing protein [Prevotella sp. oral taxon 299]|uniref:DUF6249 domain-containing protein n=1 Tax=Prevotella sp. oral taxon 299 TaxID=652716 RepID=UPI0001C3FE02|nr:DUF6249 domain-containing protein [Prevotella sp. oral taxon 299]EFC70869.1 hypothetical protein HMPREF0669_01324 [Prevotella sp. oral taxon 299 str. F0039]